MAEKTKLWYLQNFNLFEDMDENTMMGLDQNSRMQETPKKEIIYFPDEPNNTIYLIVESTETSTGIFPSGVPQLLLEIGDDETALVDGEKVYSSSKLLKKELPELLKEKGLI